MKVITKKRLFKRNCKQNGNNCAYVFQLMHKNKRQRMQET